MSEMKKSKKVFTAFFITLLIASSDVNFVHVLKS
jgi:hypothetical protein